MKKRYFFRLDDLAPEMDFFKFDRILKIFAEHGIKPLAAVIPQNQDPKIQYTQGQEKFWDLVRNLDSSGWTIAQHGFQHKFETNNGGILNMHRRSEFAGLPFETQNFKIAQGLEILKSKGVEPKVFVTPAHSFDKITLEALLHNGIKIISDGLGLYPFKKWDVLWLPQITWRPRKFPFGFLTFALHHNTMADSDFIELESFIKTNADKIGDFSDLALWYGGANFLNRIWAKFSNFIFKPALLLAFKIKHGLSR